MHRPAQPVELFPNGTLSRIAEAAQPRAPTVQPGGGERRRAATPTTEEVVRGIVASAVGSERASSGRVPPSLRGLERALDERFRPPRDTITGDTGKELAGAQLRRFNLVGPSARPLVRGEMDTATNYAGGPARELGVGVGAMEQQIAIADALNEPAEWKRAVVRVRLDDAGHPTEVSLARTSGRPRLDALAVETVREAAMALTRELRDAGPCEVHFALEAAVSVRIPSSMNGGISLLSAVPFKETLHYRVRLVELR